MKKIAILLISLLLLCALFTGIPIRKKLKYTQDVDNIRSIEIYHSEQAYNEGNISLFRQENEPIAVLEGDACTGFAQALGKLRSDDAIMLIPVPMDGGYDYEGYIVAVVYADGGYDIFAECGSYAYVVGRNGQVRRRKYDHADYCGDTPWAEIIEGYIEK